LLVLNKLHCTLQYPYTTVQYRRPPFKNKQNIALTEKGIPSVRKFRYFRRGAEAAQEERRRTSPLTAIFISPVYSPSVRRQVLAPPPCTLLLLLRLETK